MDNDIGKNIIGKKFNHPTVISFNHKKGSAYYFKCKCDCGNEVVIEGSHIKNGHTKSCGCLANRKRINGIFPKLDPKDIIGKKYGLLTVIKIEYIDKYHNYFYRCKCDCGNEVVMKRSTILSNNTLKSCGCTYHIENITHNMSKTKFYATY